MSRGTFSSSYCVLDFMWDWGSKTKYEGSFVGHTFVARRADDPSVVVDKYTLEPTRIVDCPSRKNKQVVASPTNKDASVEVQDSETIPNDVSEDPTASLLLDEVFGDSDQYLSVLHQHDTNLKSNIHTAEDKVMKEAKILTNRIVDAFTLNNSDPAFVKVQTEIDKVMSTSVTNIYGQFSELTTPILNQVRQLFLILLESIHFNYFNSHQLLQFFVNYIILLHYQLHN